MSTLPERMRALSSAEDFFAFFGVPYEESVVHVNRLHILKRFYQYLRTTPGVDSGDEVACYRSYRALLAQAYQDFVRSTPAQEKVFKVFQDAGGTQHVSAAALLDSLARRQSPAPAAHAA